MAHTKINSTNNTKFIILGVVIIGVAAAAAAIYSHDQRNTATVAPSGTNKIDYSPAPKADNNASDARKNSTSPSSTLNSTAGTTANSASPTATGGTITAQITGANVQSGNVHVGTLVTGTTSGNCTLTATKSGQTAVLQLGTASVMQDVNSYSCGVFNIATSSFTSSGNWQLNLNVVSNGNTNTGTYNVTIP